jgi:hypothetical protein
VTDNIFYNQKFNIKNDDNNQTHLSQDKVIDLIIREGCNTIRDKLKKPKNLSVNPFKNVHEL